MTSHKKTYFLPPNWDYPPPPAGPLQLGTIITHPITPSRSLNLEALQPIPRTFQNVKTDWEQTRSQIYEGRFGIWASFLQIVGIGGDIGFDKARDSSEVYKCASLETQFFVPDKQYIHSALQNDEVKAYIEANYFKKPVFMITGLKIARGFCVESTSTKSKGGDGKVGVDLTIIGAPVQLGPEVKLIVTKKENTVFKGSGDCVFAFQVVRIRSKKGIYIEEEWNKGALMHGGTEDDKKQGIDNFEENWEFDDFKTVEIVTGRDETATQYVAYEDV